jgi:hypothetical protein
VGEVAARTGRWRLGELGVSGEIAAWGAQRRRRGVKEAPVAGGGRAGIWQQAWVGASAQGERRGHGGGDEASAALVEEEVRGGAARARAKIRQPNGVPSARNQKMAKSGRGFEYIGRQFVGGVTSPVAPRNRFVGAGDAATHPHKLFLKKFYFNIVEYSKTYYKNMKFAP